jgi:hypothetical protein
MAAFVESCRRASASRPWGTGFDPSTFCLMIFPPAPRAADRAGVSWWWQPTNRAFADQAEASSGEVKTKQQIRQDRDTDMDAPSHI